MSSRRMRGHMLIESPTSSFEKKQTFETEVDRRSDEEWVESWLDDHPEFTHHYFVRNAQRYMIDEWLMAHSHPQTALLTSEFCDKYISTSLPVSSVTTPVRKISAHELDHGGLVILKPIVTTTSKGTPTFLHSNVSGSTINVNSFYKQKRLSRVELQALEEKELIFELVKDICNDLEVKSLCHKILQNVSILTRADCCSLFLVRGEKPLDEHNDSSMDSRRLVSSLFDVSSQSTIEQMEGKEQLNIPWGTGIVGHVAKSGQSVNIPDVYEDPRFNPEVDQKTGYTTKSMLCAPIKDVDGEVVGVAQVLNKIGLNGNTLSFNSNDEKVFASYLQFCGIGIKNAQLYERSELENKRNQVLLDLARMIFEEQSTIEHIVYRIMMHTQILLQCQRCQVMLMHQASKGTFSRVFDLDASDFEFEEMDRTSPCEGRFPINFGITGYVASTGKTLNIPNAYADPRFDPSVDKGAPFRTKSILCMPIKNSANEIIGVSQLINKLNGSPFNKNDENLFEAFAIFCGSGIYNTHMYESVCKAIAKQNVTLDVLSYHATASQDEADQLKQEVIPTAQYFKLYDYKFSDFDLCDKETIKACIRMFQDLDLIERFNIDYSILCRWLLSVKKNYRNITYHNWRHAFNVAQMLFSIMVSGDWCRVLGELECLALLVACLCHDLDHRGTNNSFQIKSSSVLAELYSTSTMEHHHFDQCIMILNTQGNQIFSNLSTEDYSLVIKVLEEAILSTDLAVYFRRRGSFFNLVDGKVYDWQRNDHRELLRSMMMTICDVSAIAKPWEIQKVIADLVATEFFQQGDKEKEELHIQPIDMMDRNKKDELPKMQVSFIDEICLPIYQAFAKISAPMNDLLHGVLSNKKKWSEMAE